MTGYELLTYGLYAWLGLSLFNAVSLAIMFKHEPPASISLLDLLIVIMLIVVSPLGFITGISGLYNVCKDKVIWEKKE